MERAVSAIALADQQLCTVSETGIEWHREPTPAEWEEVGRNAAEASRSLMWIVGDWLLQGESAGYLERGKLRDACERFGIAYQTAKQAARVCNAFERCLRRHHLSWHHHKEVANRDDAADLLQWAESNSASVNELRAEKKRRDEGTATTAQSQIAAAIAEAAESSPKNEAGTEGTLRELALFAGAGGGILAGHLLGWRTVCAVEQNHYAAAVLAMRQNDGSLRPFPIWDNVETFDGTRWRGRVDVVSGGFPCQDISVNGTGTGIQGERSGLWAHMARIIGEVRPRFVFVENSSALTRRGLGVVLGNLASLGFDAEWGCLSAADVGASHKRDRIWIVAHAPVSRCGDDVPSGDGTQVSVPGRDRHVFRPGRQWGTEPGICRAADGVANRVDRLKALGNGQVPAVAATAWTALGGQ